MIYLILIVILFLLMVIFGGKRGIRSFTILTVNTVVAILSIIFLYMGFSVFVVGLLSSLIFLVLTLYYQNGVNIKTTAAFISVLSIMLATGGIIALVCMSAHISGLNEIELEEGNNFMGFAVPINLFQILVLSLIWSQLGALTDTSLSISSAMNEIYEVNKSLSYNDFLKSGMTVGRDILGTTVNTLVFIGFGESLMLFLYYIDNNYLFSQIINSKSFFQTIIGVVFSCIGCVAVIPFTAFIFSLIVKKYKYK